MTIAATRLEFLGKLREAAGAPYRDFALPSHVATIGALVEWLGESEPALRAALDSPSVNFVVGDMIVGRTAAIPAGATIAFLPPFSGG